MLLPLCAKAASASALAALICTGAGDRNRTDDPVITSDVLYQLSYTSSELLIARCTRPRGDVPYQLSYTSSLVFASHVHSSVPSAWRTAVRTDGATPQNRTGDTTIFSRVLYQLS